MNERTDRDYIEETRDAREARAREEEAAKHDEGYATRRESELGGKSPEELEAEIEHIRQELDATLRQIERKFSPSEIFDRAWHNYVKGGPGDYASHLNNAIKANPIPAALLGVSLGWLMLSGEGQRERSGAEFERYREKGGETTEKLKSKMEDVSHKVSDTMHRAGEKLHSVGDKARNARRQWGESRHQMGERSGEAMHNLGERVHGARERFDESTHRYGERMRQRRGSIAESIHEQPLLLGVFGIAAGALIGAMLPPTRQEDEWLGESADRMRQRAQETGREQLEKAKHIAGAAAETAREEAERQLH